MGILHQNGENDEIGLLILCFLSVICNHNNYSAIFINFFTILVKIFIFSFVCFSIMIDT